MLHFKEVNGGLLNSHYELSFPKAQVIDSINLKVEEFELDESFLKEKYVKEGFSSKEIGKLTFSSRVKVNAYLKKHNIPFHKITRRVNGHHVFGYQKYKSASIPLNREQRILDEIKKYRECGYSYQKIADSLNNQNVKTKQGKGCWKAKVVRQIFLRIQKS